MSTIYGTTGDDQLAGTSDGDVLDGGAGNDMLAGGLGSDTYVFGQGYGNDEIFNEEPDDAQSVDRIRLNPEVTPQDVTLKVITQDAYGNPIPPALLLTLRSTGETLVVHKNFATSPGGVLAYAIDFIEFADGTVWDAAEIDRRAHLIEGTAGDDYLLGTLGDDVLDGGAGNDVMVGMEGSDVYLFGLGSGNDQIYNYEPEGGQSIDRIRLKPEVNPADVELKLVQQDAVGNWIPDSLQLRLRSTGETLLVRGHFDTSAGGPSLSAVDAIEFADGTVWDLAEIDRRAHLVEGTVGDDWLVGTTGNDVLDGGAGNDHLAGDLGADTYMFGQGSGHDTIHNFEPDGMTAPDRILLKPEVSAADVQLKVVTVDANGWGIPPSLQLMLRSTGETLTVLGQFDTQAIGMNPAIDSVEFADGTVWDLAEIDRRAHLIEGTVGDDWLVGTTGNDVLDGGAGNDHLAGDLGADTYIFGQGSGHDLIHNFEPDGMTAPDRILLKPEVSAADVELKVVTLDANGWSIAPSLQLRLKSTGETLTVYGHFDTAAVGMNPAIDAIEFADGTVWDQLEIERRAHLFEGTVGDDVLMGTTGNDVLDGGAGNDVLLGDLGADTYVFGQGSGNDMIENYEPEYNQALDRIQLKPEVTTADVELRSVTTDANGWSIPASLQLRLKSTGETLLVRSHFATWDGTPTTSAIDAIEFADGTVWDKTEIERRAHLFEGTAGDDVLMGTTGNDVLDGGAGNDVLLGDLGSDTYVFGRGDGADLVYEYDATPGNSDVAQFEPSITTDQLWFRQLGSSLEVSVIGTSDAFTINDWFAGSQGHVEQFKTADGKTLLDSDVQNLVQAMAAFTPPPMGQTTLTEGYATVLNPVIAANWQ